MPRYFRNSTIEDLKKEIDRLDNIYNIKNVVAKDLKVKFDLENYESDEEHEGLHGYRTLSNGLSFLGISAGGDGQWPVFFICYLDKAGLRAYIPTKGNVFNKKTMEAYGANECGGDFDFKLIEEDIVERILPETEDVLTIFPQEEIKSILDLYVVINSDGQYFRAKGYGGSGDSWVDEIKNAKVYTKIGVARSRVTWWKNNFPSYPTPKIGKLIVVKVEILNEEKRVTQAIQKIKEQKVKDEISTKKQRVKIAKEELLRAQQKLNELNS